VFTVYTELSLVLLHCTYCISVKCFTCGNTVITVLQWPCFGVLCIHMRGELLWLIVMVILTHNRNKTLVKLRGAQTNHVHVNAAMHQPIDGRHWVIRHNHSRFLTGKEVHCLG
jgi:hypothetical protein